MKKKGNGEEHQTIFCDGNCPNDPDAECGKELPVYTVDIIRHEGKGKCSIVQDTIEQMNTISWPVFVPTKMPPELRDMILAALLTYSFGGKSIDRHWARISMMRETDSMIETDRKKMN